MKTPHIPRSLAVAMMSLALAASAGHGYAGTDANPAGALAPVDLSNAPPMAAARPSIDRTAAVTLYLEDPNGNAVRLVHRAGTGWTYATGSRSEPGHFTSLFRKVAWRAPATIVDETNNATEALTVFIDGPSGFTFVWTPEGSWKFVGKIAARRS